jgi:hypothetical protein
MRSTHRKTKSWLETAKRHHITDPNGNPSKGLAYRIAVDEYEPKGHETLTRIGMPCPCDECKKAKRQTKRIAHQDLFDMTTDAIINALNNREEMPPRNYNKRVMDEFIKACKRGGAMKRVSAS